MKKRNIVINRNVLKLVGTVMAMSLLFSTNVYAEELDEFVNSEDITTMSDEIDTLGDQVDTLNENNSDDELSDDISTISDGIDTLDDLLSSIMSSFNSLKSSLSKYKSNIISALNSNVYAQNNISSDASFEEVVDKINDIKYMGTVDITLDSNDSYTLESGYYDGVTIDVSAIYEAARKEGFDAGREEGKTEGYNEAIAKEKDKWIKTGYDSAISAEKNNWINEGKNAKAKEVKARTYKEQTVTVYMDNTKTLTFNNLSRIDAVVSVSVNQDSAMAGVIDLKISGNTVTFVNNRRYGSNPTITVTARQYTAFN